jgi:hypothetical protein
MTTKQERKIIEHEAKVTTNLGGRISWLIEIQGRLKDGKENTMRRTKTKKAHCSNNLLSQMPLSLLLGFPSPKFFVSITLISNAAFDTSSRILASVVHPEVRMDFTVSCVISVGFTLTKSNLTVQLPHSQV